MYTCLVEYCELFVFKNLQEKTFESSYWSSYTWVKLVKKHSEAQKQIKLTIYFSKFKSQTSSLRTIQPPKKSLPTQTSVVYKFTCLFRECFSEK